MITFKRLQEIKQRYVTERSAAYQTRQREVKNIIEELKSGPSVSIHMGEKLIELIKLSRFEKNMQAMLINQILEITQLPVELDRTTDDQTLNMFGHLLYMLGYDLKIDHKKIDRFADMLKLAKEIDIVITKDNHLGAEQINVTLERFLGRDERKKMDLQSALNEYNEKHVERPPKSLHEQLAFEITSKIAKQYGFTIEGNKKMGPYELDIYLEKNQYKVNIEIDGGHHKEELRKNADTIRDIVLRSKHHINVIRIEAQPKETIAERVQEQMNKIIKKTEESTQHLLLHSKTHTTSSDDKPSRLTYNRHNIGH